MFSQAEFFQSTGLTVHHLDQARVTFDELERIYRDYQARAPELQDAGDSLIRHLSRAPKAHSVKSRLKSPYRLLAKVVKKRTDNPERDINLQTYATELTDLVGVRILHLVKSDWPEIDLYLRKKWKRAEGPVANVRVGDVVSLYTDNGCEVRPREQGYRSVHYIVEVPSGQDTPVLAEVQVRTLFEEAWSEIDHRFRYSNPTPNPMTDNLLLTFNRVSGTADELGELLTSIQAETQAAGKQWEQLTHMLHEKGVMDVATGKLIASLSSNPLVDMGNRLKPFMEFFGPMNPVEHRRFEAAHAYSKVVTCKTHLKNIATGLEMWCSDNGGRYPDALSQLTEGSYIREIPKCPGLDTGGDYAYQRIETERYDMFTLTCTGLRHEAYGLQADYPRYTSEGGLYERATEG